MLQSPLRFALYSLAVLVVGLVAGVVVGLMLAPELAVQLERWQSQENELLTSSLESQRRVLREQVQETVNLTKQVHDLLERNADLEAEVVKLEAQAKEAAEAKP